MKVFVTGIGGFVGSFLANHLRAEGHTVCGSARRADNHQNIVQLQLGEACSSSMFEGQDAVIHCAWDIRSSEASFNVDATRRVLASAKEANVRTQLFVSTLSALPTATTIYGRDKLAAESLFDLVGGDVVIRPGLIVGNGGLFRQTYDFVRTKPVIPLIGGGKFAVPLIAAPTLAQAVSHLLANRYPPRPCQLFHNRVPTQRELVEMVCRQRVWHRILLPLPSGLALTSLKLAERLHLNLAIKSANLEAALTNRINPADSDLAQVLGRMPPFSEILSQIEALP